MPTHYLDVDPLSFAIRPPPDETDEARQGRLRREAEANTRSNTIDEFLRIEREALRRKRGTHADVKLLLLGKALKELPGAALKSIYRTGREW